VWPTATWTSASGQPAIRNPAPSARPPRPTELPLIKKSSQQQTVEDAENRPDSQYGALIPTTFHDPRPIV
jgi:hypothetical protein